MKLSITETIASVIIPTFNSKAYLVECIDSLESQTFKKFEIIVVDDGSTDNTHEVIRKFLNNITYIRQNNQGPSSARNKGIENSRGKYLCFLDADDLYKPNHLSELIGFLEENQELGYAFSDLEQFQENHIINRSMIAKWGEDFNKIPHDLDRKKRRIFTTVLTPFLIKYRSFIHTSTITIRRRKLPSKPWFHEGLHYGEDAELWARVAYHSKGGYIDKVLSRKRVVDNSLIHDKSRKLKNIDHLLKIREKQLDFYKGDEKTTEIIKDQISDFAAEYCWGLASCGFHKEARQKIYKYIKRYPFSGKLLKVLIKTLVKKDHSLA